MHVRAISLWRLVKCLESSIACVLFKYLRPTVTWKPCNSSSDVLKGRNVLFWGRGKCVLSSMLSFISWTWGLNPSWSSSILNPTWSVISKTQIYLLEIQGFSSDFHFIFYFLLRSVTVFPVSLSALLYLIIEDSWGSHNQACLNLTAAPYR